MATYKDLQDRINLDYLNQMTLIPEVKRAILVAIRTYEARRFWFNEASTAVATVASQSYITVPSDYLFGEERLELTVNGSTAALKRTSFAHVRDMNMNSTNSQPTHYAYHGDRLELAMVPDAAYTGNLHYIRSLPTLSADADTNAWTNEASSLIAHAACVELMSSVLQVHDNAKVERHRMMALLSLSDLGARNDARLITKLRPTYF